MCPDSGMVTTPPTHSITPDLALLNVAYSAALHEPHTGHAATQDRHSRQALVCSASGACRAACVRHLRAVGSFHTLTGTRRRSLASISALNLFGTARRTSSTQRRRNGLLYWHERSSVDIRLRRSQGMAWAALPRGWSSPVSRQRRRSSGGRHAGDRVQSSPARSSSPWRDTRAC